MPKFEDLKPVIKGTVIIVAPHMDLPTTFSAEAAFELADWLETHGVKYKMLYGVQANPYSFKFAIRLFKPKLICYYGHGTPSSLFGQWGNMVTVESAYILGNQLVYTMACESAKELGKRVGELNGNYFGSTQPMYGGFPEFEHNYLKDFIECWNIIPRYLLAGYTAEKALQAYKSRCSYYIDMYESMTDKWVNADWYADAMRENRDWYVFIGDIDTNINVVREPLINFKELVNMNLWDKLLAQYGALDENIKKQLMNMVLGFSPALSVILLPIITAIYEQFIAKKKE